jgi:predicted permease
MNELLTVLTAVLPVFGVMGVGFWLRRVGWLTADADQSLMRLTINLLMPSLIFDSVLGSTALRRPENLLLPPLLGYGMMAVGVGVARCFTGLAGMRTKPEQRTFTLLAGLQNYSYLTIPLCLSLFGSGTMGVLFVHNVGTDMAMWTLGIATLTGAGTAGGWKKILNAPLVALLLALALNFLSLHCTPPAPAMFAGGIVRTTIHWFGQSAIPMALLMIGAIVADHFEEARGGKRRARGDHLLARPVGCDAGLIFAAGEIFSLLGGSEARAYPARRHAVRHVPNSAGQTLRRRRAGGRSNRPRHLPAWHRNDSIMDPAWRTLRPGGRKLGH